MSEQKHYDTVKQDWYYAGYPYEKHFSWKVLAGYDERTTPVSTAPLPSGEYYLPTSYRSVYVSANPQAFMVQGFTSPQGFAIRTTGSGRQRHETWYAANSGLFHGCYNSWPHWPVLPAVLKLQLKEKLASKVLNSDFNLGQTLGEMPETVALIAELGIKALRAIRAIKRGRLGAVRDIGKDILDRRIGELGGDYLTYQYGIKPLVNEAYALAKSISEGLNDKRIIRVKALVMDTNFGAPTASHYYPHVRAVGQFRRGIAGQYVLSVRNPYLYDLDRLGILNPAALAWELFPLSFVIDWFLHIGSFLQGLSLPLSLKFEHGYFTEFVNNSWEAVDTDPTWSGTLPRIVFRQKAMARDAVWTFPYPLPYFHVNLNLSKVISMIALALATKRG